MFDHQMGNDLFVIQVSVWFGRKGKEREQPWILMEDVPTHAISFSSRNSSESFSSEQSL
jgi:hypothetical protein